MTGRDRASLPPMPGYSGVTGLGLAKMLSRRESDVSLTDELSRLTVRPSPGLLDDAVSKTGHGPARGRLIPNFKIPSPPENAISRAERAAKVPTAAIYILYTCKISNSITG